MSALTDLFSSYANKIRSKVGGSETYTPTEMVDAIDDVYDAGAASVSLQASKTVTATTSSQTVEPDTGYVGMEEVVVNPQAHTTTYTPSTNTSANDMGANHDYRYVDTSGMITPTGTKRITLNGTSDVTNYATVDVNVTTTPTEVLLPSNSDPHPIYNGHDYRSQGNGYAIASYDEITPSSNYEEVSSGDIVKFGGNGWVLDQPPIDITPSNSTPPILRDIFPFKVTTNGFAIESYNTKTPSNSSPVALASGEIDKIGGNGYAIENYDSVTPSSTPTSVSSGDIVKIGGSGVIVDSIPTPTNITPSNSSPVALSADTPVNPTASGYAISSYSSITPSNSSPATITSGNIYKASANGKAVASVTDITPSNSSPVSLSSGTIYKPSASGYAISSYSSKTPSDSSPASVSSGAIIKASSSGYLYESNGLGKIASGSFEESGSTERTITLGFEPKYLCIFQCRSSEGNNNILVYNKDLTTNYTYRRTRSSSSYTGANVDLPSTNTSSTNIHSISSTGFTIYCYNSLTFGSNYYYFAIG